MEPFELRWRASTKNDLRKLPPQEVARIISAVEQLAREPLPHGSEKLAGSEQTYRVRVGDYRIVYEVLSQARVVEIQRVRHRRDVYRN
jgi:mRNA interferase RelE/StbE